MRLGVDIGGTFTDFVCVDAAGRVRLHKRLTTPDDPARSVVEGAAELDVPADPAAQVVHGSTNALLERRGARTTLITTLGFADVLEIGRQNRPELYALAPHRPPPLVPREWRFELPERLSAQGDVLIPLDPQAVLDLVPRLQAAQIESVYSGRKSARFGMLWPLWPAGRSGYKPSSRPCYNAASGPAAPAGPAPRCDARLIVPEPLAHSYSPPACWRLCRPALKRARPTRPAWPSPP